MKKTHLILTLLCSLALPLSVPAQAPANKGGEKKAPAPKGPADLALDEFNKARNDPANRTAAGFPKVIAAGIAFLTQFPTHGQANTVANQLGRFGNSIDAKQAALRTSYVSLLKLEVANQRYKEGVTDPAKAALAAVDAVAADFEMRMAPGREALATLREKIDALAETPGGGRFLADRERAYAHMMIMTNQTPRAEEMLKKLSKHSERGVADMARQELNILELKKTPIDLKFATIDGKEVDLAQMRGKVVALYFWSTANKASRDQFEQLRMIHSDHRKKGFEVVTVSFDKEEDREKVQKFIKESKLPFAVQFDGKAGKNEFAPKLNAYSVPRLMLFDKAGMLQTINVNNNLTANFPLNQLDAAVKKLVAAK